MRTAASTSDNSVFHDSSSVPGVTEIASSHSVRALFLAASGSASYSWMPSTLSSPMPVK